MSHRSIRFRNKTSFIKRKQLSKKFTKTYNDRIPIIVEPYFDTDIWISHSKYLISSDLMISEVISELYKFMPNKATALALSPVVERIQFPLPKKNLRFFRLRRQNYLFYDFIFLYG